MRGLQSECSELESVNFGTGFELKHLQNRAIYELKSLMWVQISGLYGCDSVSDLRGTYGVDVT